MRRHCAPLSNKRLLQSRQYLVARAYRAQCAMLPRSIYKAKEVNRAKPSLTRPRLRTGGLVHGSVAQGLRDHLPVFILQYQSRVRSQVSLLSRGTQASIQVSSQRRDVRRSAMRAGGSVRM